MDPLMGATRIRRRGRTAERRLTPFGQTTRFGQQVRLNTITRPVAAGNGRARNEAGAGQPPLGEGR